MIAHLSQVDVSDNALGGRFLLIAVVPIKGISPFFPSKLAINIVNSQRKIQYEVHLHYLLL
jgi:hypothetical protein